MGACVVGGPGTARFGVLGFGSGCQQPVEGEGKYPFQCIGFRKKIDSPSGIGLGEAFVGSRGVSDSGRRRRD